MSKEAFQEYMEGIQMTEEAIVVALQNSKIVVGNRQLSLRDALNALAQMYGTTTESGRAATAMAINTNTALDMFQRSVIQSMQARKELFETLAPKKEEPDVGHGNEGQG